MIWHGLRQRLPARWKIAYRQIRARLLDPLDRGIIVTIGGQSARVPAYFRGDGRADYESAAIARFARWLEAHPTAAVVDVGCSICLYGLIALTRQPRVVVVGLDSDLVSLKCAQWLCAKAGLERLQLVHGFAGPRHESGVTLAAALAATATALADPALPRFVEMTRYREMTQSDTGHVPRHALDALWSDAAPDRPRLLKIDVEGHELAVLEGARDFLARLRPVILLSVHPQFFPRLGTTTGALREFLAAADYRPELFAVDHEEHWWCEPATPA